MSAGVIIWSEFEHDGETYLITVRKYDAELVTAHWSSCSKNGELGYGIIGCDAAIEAAQRAIVEPPARFRPN